MSTCLLCNAPVQPMLDGVRDTRFGVPGTWTIMRCDACGLLQTEPRPDAAELTRLYEAHYNLGGEGGTAYGKAREKFLFSTPYRIWLALDATFPFTRKGAPAGSSTSAATRAAGSRSTAPTASTPRGWS